MPGKIGYDHRFIPCGHRGMFVELPAIKRWSHPKSIVAIKQLPFRKLVLPELLAYIKWFPMDPMLIALMDGTWGLGVSWKVYARLLLVRRIVAAQDTLLAPFAEQLPEIQDFVLYGGSRKVRRNLLGQLHDITVEKMEVASIHSSARFLGSCLGEDPTMSLLRPFHWLRTAYIHTDPVPMLGLGAMQKENMQQKDDLLDLMKTKVSKKIITELS